MVFAEDCGQCLIVGVFNVYNTNRATRPVQGLLQHPPLPYFSFSRWETGHTEAIKTSSVQKWTELPEETRHFKIALCKLTCHWLRNKLGHFFLLLKSSFSHAASWTGGVRPNRRGRCTSTKTTRSESALHRFYRAFLCSHCSDSPVRT